MAAVFAADQCQAAGRHQQPQHAGQAQPLTEKQRSKTEGEESLRLQDQRSQPWRHAAVHGLKQERELAQ